MTLRRQQKRERKTKISNVLRSYQDLVPYDQVWVIGDIHSCYHTLKTLCEQLPKQAHSIYIFLGDYINKGHYPQETLDFLIAFSVENECIFLRGNHDQMLLDAWQLKEPIYIDQIKRLGSGSLLGQREKYEAFFASTLHYLESETHFFVHAGFDFTLTNPYEDIERMMMIREVKYDALKANWKKVVRGHFPVTITQIRDDILQARDVISLDNGCVYPQREGMGRLIALELLSMKLLEQKNID